MHGGEGVFEKLAFGGHRKVRTTWTLEDCLREGTAETCSTPEPVDFTGGEIEKYYFGLSNEALWPFFLDMPTLSNFDPS